MKNYILICLITISCEISEKVDYRQNDEQLILINGFLSPEEEMIKVKVSKTMSVFDEPLQIEPIDFEEVSVIKDAVVTIKNENQEEITLAYSSQDKVYQIAATAFLIMPGKSYNLTVIAEGKEFKAVCTIPMKKIESATVINELKNENGSQSYNLNVSFDDIIGENSFYIVGASYNTVDSINENRLVDFDIERFVTDVNGDGLKISTNGTINNTYQTLEVVIEIANVDEHIYATLRASFLNRDQENNEAPFYQPIIPPSNIEGDGGYGVFGGFRLLKKTITLDPI
jgi:uncharacterized protein YcfL